MLTGDVDVRQEAHLELPHAITATRLAASALHVEAEASRTIPPRLRAFGLRKEFADLREEAHIGGGIRPRGASNRTLVDFDDLVDVFHARQLSELAGHRLRPVKAPHQLPLERLLDQRGLAAAAHACHDREGPQRNLHRNVLQVVLGAAGDREVLARSRLFD